MTKRIAIGSLMLESNTFAPRPTTVADFEKTYSLAGEALITGLRDTRTEMAGAIAALVASDAEPVPLYAAHGMAGGVLRGEDWEVLRERLLAPLRTAGRVDGIYLALHGAMMTETSQDAESDILAAVRELAGDVPIAVSCDLHANVTPRMVALADLIVGYQLYPHDDTYETGGRAIGLLLRTLAGEIRPVMAMRKAPMMIPGVRQITSARPMSDIFDLARGFESAGTVVSASYFPTFSKFDGPDIGFRGVAIADGDAGAADRAALAIARAGWERRHRFEVDLVPIEDAVRRGLEVLDAPVILVDAGDCVGGGAAGDSAAVLASLLAIAPDAASAILVNDAETVQQARAAGIGATIEARIGNKITPMYGAPVQASARVEALCDGRFTYAMGIAKGVTASMGQAAVLRIGGARVVCCSVSSYEYGDEQFVGAGLDVRGFKFIVSKTVGNYVKAYPGATAFLVDAPGPQTHNLRRLPWTNISRPLYPWDDGFSPDFEAGKAINTRLAR
jgi:microcystin degradation protein MlrC